MARSRLRRSLLWGLVLLPVVALAAAYALGRAWINRQLHRDLHVGRMRIQMSGPRLGWALDFTADSLRIAAPAFRASTGPVQARLRLWHSLLNLTPSFQANLDILRVDLAGRPRQPGPKAFRLRTDRPAAFPRIRIPVPFRVEAGRVEVTRTGRPVVSAAEVAFYSQGPKGAAVKWTGTRLDSATAMPGEFRASARWFGQWVRYQARFQGETGDVLRLEGERRKSDLSRGKDSLEAEVASLEPYARILAGRRPDAGLASTAGRPAGGRGWSSLSGIRVAASLRHAGSSRDGSRERGGNKGAAGSGIAVEARVDLRVPGPMRLGPLDVTARLSFQDSSGRLTAEARGGKGETARLQGLFRLPLGDSLVPAALPRDFEGTFSGFTRDVRFRIGRWTLPGDFEIRRLRVAGGEARAEARSRDNSVVAARLFRDTAAAPAGPGRKAPWRLTFTGDASPAEPWARIWTGANVNYRSAAVTGEFRPGELVVELRGRGVTAYGAAADSLWTRNIIRRRGYYLEDSRLYWKNLVWPVQGEVEWTERRPVRGPRGLRLRREVSLSFRAAHPSHGRFEFAMPRRGSMVVTAEGLEAEFLPMPRLAQAAAYHPRLDGRFAWDWKEKDGEADLRAGLVLGGRRLDAALRAAWDPDLLKVPGLDLAMGDSRLSLAAVARLNGRQFHQVRRLRLADIRGLSMEARHFEAARLDALFPSRPPLEAGTLDGRLTYSDSLGFQGGYRVSGLRAKALRRLMEIPTLSIEGRGKDLSVAATAVSAKHAWLNGSVRLRALDPLGARPGLELAAVSEGGLTLGFQGEAPEWKALQGAFTAEGGLSLPGGAGTLRDFKIAGRLSAPLDRGFVPGLRVDSAVARGRYAVPGLDTQELRGEAWLRDGRIAITSFRATDAGGRTLSGDAEARLGKPLLATARLKGPSLALELKDVPKLAFRDVEASLRADSSGLAAEARAGGASFQARRGAVGGTGELENLVLTYAKARAGEGGREAVPKVGVKARLHHLAFKHRIGFREMQRSIRTVKVDKRRKRIKPVELDVSLEAAGPANRVETDILRMFFTGDLAVRGIYPYTLLTGEISALSGEIGQTSQSYEIKDFGLKWQNATMEEGRVRVEGAKKLRVDCRPETRRTCNVYIKLEGRLDEMAFSYDSDCGQTAGGQVIEPAALINSVSRGCYSGDYVSGAGGGGGYGEAMFTFLEPAISENLSRRVSKVTDGWIKSTQVSGIGAVVSKDTAAHSEPISVSLETRQWKGVRGMARAGYHPENTVNNPWENKVAVEWRLPLEKVASDSGWKRRVRDRVTLEASAETRPEQKLKAYENEVREQIGLRYRFKFWKLW